MRNADGTFADGNPGGPGRPRREVEAGYLAGLTDKVTPEDWGEIVTRAVRDAKNGDARAREWLGRYLVGEKVLDALRRNELKSDGTPYSPEQELEQLLGTGTSSGPRADLATTLASKLGGLGGFPRTSQG